MAALSPEDFEIFRQHLAKFPKQADCPICQSKVWNVVGLEVANGLTLGETHIGGKAMPTVKVVCNRCFFVRQWAWFPIKETAGEAENG